MLQHAAVHGCQHLGLNFNYGSKRGNALLQCGLSAHISGFTFTATSAHVLYIHYPLTTVC